MLTELSNKPPFTHESNSLFSVQSGICKVVPVHAMQTFRGVEAKLRTHTHSLNPSTTVNGDERSPCQATPMPTEQEAGWEPELAWTL
jgi:hypothetical protein